MNLNAAQVSVKNAGPGFITQTILLNDLGPTYFVSRITTLPLATSA